MYAPHLYLVALLAATPQAGTASLLLEIQAEAALTAEARSLGDVSAESLARLAGRLGLEGPGDPIQVRLVAEASPIAQQTPAWISGWAYGSLDTVYLLPQREPSYPDGSLEELLRHEVVHVLLYRAAGGRDLPRWFHEGVALELARPWGLDDRSRLTLALLLNERVPIASLGERFAGSPGEVRRAYAVSGALVREIVRAFGPGTLASILERVSIGVDFEEAFYRTTGTRLAGFETGFWRRYSLWYRWLPLITSGLAMWLAIVLLALWAGTVRSRRRAEIERRWDEEEAPEALDPPGSTDQVH